MNKIEKPPIGIKPRRFHDSNRGIDIAQAIIRYFEAGQPIPDEWMEELIGINFYLRDIKEHELVGK